MIIKLKKGEVVFRNPNLLASDTKVVNLDRVLTNLYMQIFANGAPITLATRREDFSVSNLKHIIEVLEDNGYIYGAKENSDAVEDWLRSNLIDMVFRGNVVKEKVASLRPMHLMSFRVQNRKFCRDYNTADQLYIMLRSNREVLQGLKTYLCQGWDTNTGSIVGNAKMDVDTAGVLLLTQNLKEKLGNNTTSDKTTPFLTEQTKLFNKDICRLLVYQNHLPRIVFIEYLRILCGFHLALYCLKLIYMLPKCVEAGTRGIKDDWSLIVDLSDNLSSPLAPYAAKDLERLTNNYRDYVRATYIFNIVQQRLFTAGRDNSTDATLATIKNGINHSDGFYESRYADIRQSYRDNIEEFDEMMQYFDNEDYFDKYLYLLEKSNLGNAQLKFLTRHIDACAMKNTSSMLLADGRSHKAPRRGAIGSRLLETLVQILVLEPGQDGKYTTRTLSIEELVDKIRSRYGLIINGLNDARFADADVELNAAFSHNMEALKNKLRQIGFYTDLSDACILQKIHPRYNIN